MSRATLADPRQGTSLRRLWTDASVEIGRISRFGIVGIVATLAYTGTAFSGVEWFGLSPVVASILGQLVAAGISYFGHAYFSFRIIGHNRLFLSRFLLVGAVTFAANGGITWFMTSVMEVPHRASIAVMTILIPIINYLANRFWVFKLGIVQERPVIRH